VEFGSWHTIEVYCKAGDANTGRFAYWHDGEKFFDRALQTVPDGQTTLKDIAILKVYGSVPEYLHDNGGYLTEVWFDDMEIWNSLPEATSLEQPIRIYTKEMRPAGQRGTSIVVNMLGRSLVGTKIGRNRPLSAGIRLFMPERSRDSEGAKPFVFQARQTDSPEQTPE
jgi:hypothetical protein